MYVKILLKNFCNGISFFIVLVAVDSERWEVKVEIRCVKINKKMRAKNFFSFKLPSRLNKMQKFFATKMNLKRKLHEITSVYKQ